MSSTFPLPPLDRLPSGRHRLSREAVQESQRGRLMFAIVRAVAEKGFGAVTVADIVDRASVSRTTFYEHFEDKETCFLAAFNFGVEFVLGEMSSAWERIVDHSDWREHIRSDLATFLQTLAAEPAFARSLHIEVMAAGAAALDRRAEIFALFSARTKSNYELARSQDLSLPELPDEVFKLHTGGLDELVREQLRTRGADALPELVEPLIDATLALFGVQRGREGRPRRGTNKR